VSRLLLWRHGLTEWNAAGRIQGQLDAPLADEGIRQAEKAAAVLAALGPASIVSSDLARARRTAEELAVRTGLTVSVDPRLRERHWGDWQGSTHAELQVADPERYAAWRDGGRIDVPGAETNEVVGARAADALRAAASTGDTVVVVSHGGALRYGLASLLGTPGLPRVLGTLGNCRWADVRARGDRWVLHAYNLGA
jgi:probable phosphoglycerate mutase